MLTHTTPLARWRVLLLLLMLVLLGNWFFTFQVYSLKDDNSYYYMPMRMFISDALHHGEFPYWNPYFQLGFPQHSDIQGAVWNPFAFLPALLFHYNHTAFLFEYLCYILIAATGMYKLSGLCTTQSSARFFAVIVYIFCGFTSAIANFMNWAASLGCIPWLFYCSYVLLQQPNLRRAVLLGVVVWLMIVAGYPGFFIYAAYLLLLFFTWQAYRLYKQQQGGKIIAQSGYLLIAAIVALLLSLPAFISYLEFFPYYNRGSHLATELSFRDCVYPQYFSSWLVPAGVYNTNVDEPSHSANRDLYFGVLPMVLLLLFATKWKQYKDRFTGLFTFLAVFTFIFLFGFLTPIGDVIYKYVPLMGTSKWSGSARIFLVIIFLFALLQLFNKATTLALPLWIKIILWLWLAGVIADTYYFHYYTHFVTEKHHTLFLINAAWQVLLIVSLICFHRYILQKQWRIVLFVLIDLLVNHAIGMGMTGIATVPPSVFNKYTEKFYQQQPDAYLMEEQGMRCAAYQFDPWTNHNASKIICPNYFIQSNTMFKGYEALFVNDTIGIDIQKKHPFIFSLDVPQIQVSGLHLSYNAMKFTVTAPADGHIIIQQNNYFRWREVNGHRIDTYKDCMMQLEVVKGVNTFELQYNKGNYPRLISASIFFFMLVMIYLFISRRKAKPVLSTGNNTGPQ